MRKCERKIARVITYFCLFAILIPNFVLAQNGQWINFTSANSGMKGTIAQALAIDKSGNVWIAAYPYVIKFDGNSWMTHEIQHTTGGGITIDRSGNVWVAEVTAGIEEYNGST